MAETRHADEASGRQALPPELVAERQRIDRLAADADRRAERHRFRRRALVPAAVASGVLASTGLLSAWARATAPAAPAAAANVSSTTSASGAASSEETFLARLRQTLRADQRAIAGLPQVAASDFASSASAPPVGGGAAAPSSAAPSPIASLPPISLPPISVPPTVHATTGASGIP